MTSTAKKLLDEARCLPEEERRRLGEAILDTVPGQPAEQNLEAWVAEARRRAEQAERGQAELLDVDSALAHLRTELASVHQG